MCTEPRSPVISINFLYVGPKIAVKWHEFIDRRDDGYDRSLNKLLPFLNIKIKLAKGKKNFNNLTKTCLLYPLKTSRNDRQFCQGEILYLHWHQLTSSSSGNSLQTADFSNLNI